MRGHVLENIFDVAIALATDEDTHEIAAAYAIASDAASKAIQAHQQAEQVRARVLRRVLDRVPESTVVTSRSAALSQ